MSDDIENTVFQLIAETERDTTVDTYFQKSDEAAKSLADLYIGNRDEVTSVLREIIGPETPDPTTNEEFFERMQADVDQLNSGDSSQNLRELQAAFAREVLDDLEDLYPEIEEREGGFLPNFSGDVFAVEAFERSVVLRAERRGKPLDTPVKREKAIDWAKCEATIAAAERQFPVGAKIRLGDGIVTISSYSIDLDRDSQVLVHFSSKKVVMGREIESDDLEQPMDIYEFEDAVAHGNVNRIDE